MRYQAILFDMDGTLVPMDMDQFTRGYFKLLAKKLAPHGITPEKLVEAVWAGTFAMVKNDGSATNRQVFWGVFGEKYGIHESLVGDDCLDFYTHEFQQAKAFTGENPLAVRAVELAHEKAPVVCLATNPIFPREGQITRMSWVGLKPGDFDFVSCYDDDCFCKPNPAYYLSLCQRLGVEPSQCLMIGNDENEDMYAASGLGMDCYLVTDNMVPCAEHPWNGPRGTFAELVQMLEAL